MSGRLSERSAGIRLVARCVIALSLPLRGIHGLVPYSYDQMRNSYRELSALITSGRSIGSKPQRNASCDFDATSSLEASFARCASFHPFSRLIADSLVLQSCAIPPYDPRSNMQPRFDEAGIVSNRSLQVRERAHDRAEERGASLRGLVLFRVRRCNCKVLALSEIAAFKRAITQREVDRRPQRTAERRSRRSREEDGKKTESVNSDDAIYSLWVYKCIAT